ncbi:hypothetical protein QFZ52_000246 [Arthrobacter woluwensis]|uniref:hypothetical protein n=1 Tax=Arthrobacter woluwensis TaxID=156980 RepID=UPI0027840D77|nr:hypothetical protein [Arthrobacter woluwensis]MDQ0707594.1 hypothetical protein [Arthrobacter woluwensis]
MSGRRVAPPSARTARARTRSRGARRADTGALAAWGVATPRHRPAVSLATLSAVLLVSTALVSGGTSQPELAAEHAAAPHAQAKGSTSGTSGVVLSRPADHKGGSRTAVGNGSAKQSGEVTAPPANGSGATSRAGATDEQAHLTSQSSDGNASGTGTVAPQPGPTVPAPDAGGGAPGDGDAEPPAPGTPAEPEPSAPANPSAPPVVPPVVQPPVTQPPAPKPPAPQPGTPQPGTPQPGTPAPQPPQNSGCTITILGIRICLPLLGG